MQRLISVKSASDLPDVFKGKVTFQVVDNNVEAVVFTEGEESIRIVTNGTYSNHLKILAQQPKKQVTKYKLYGSVQGMTMVPEIFETEHEAVEKRAAYSCRSYDGEFDLKIEPIVEFVDEEKI